jgi:hypothetical protein
MTSARQTFLRTSASSSEAKWNKFCLFKKYILMIKRQIISDALNQSIIKKNNLKSNRNTEY